MLDRQGFELFPFIFTFQGFTRNVAPITMGFPVVHNKRVAPETAGYSEGVNFVLKFADIHDARIAKRSPAYRYVRVSYEIVDYLVLV